MVEWIDFARLLARYAKVNEVAPEDILFGERIDLSSIAFTEFIMELEEEHGLDIDVENLEPGTLTAGQLHAFITRQD